MANFAISDLVPEVDAGNGIRAMRVTGNDVPETDPVLNRPRSRKEEVVLTRDTRSGFAAATLTIPDGAVGVLISHQVHGVTGTFGAGEGHQFNVLYSQENVGDRLSTYRSPFQTGDSGDNEGQALLIYPGADPQILQADGGSDWSTSENPELLAAVSLPLPETVRVSLNITGSFGSGEGVDSEIRALWFFA